MIIESNDSSHAQIEKAMQSILDMGQKSFYPVKERLEKTHNPRYFYLLEKLQQSPQKEWSKVEYFWEQYQKSRELAKQGKFQDALKLAQAILVLEPALEFQDEIKIFMEDCKVHSSKDLEIKSEMRFSQEYYSFGEEVVLELHLVNPQLNDIMLFASKNHGIVADITQIDYFMEGNQKSETNRKILPWGEEIKLRSGERKIFTLRIPNNSPSLPVYRVWQIKASIPLCRLAKEQIYSYPKIFFGEREVPSLPSAFSHLLKNPWNSCSWAISLGYDKHLFYASFFLNQKEKKELIPRLIAILNYPGNIAVVSFQILKRWTKQNFASRSEWESWWQARGSFWKE